MTILIVDDDIHVVQSLCKRVRWQHLGIDQVRTACNIRQAKSVLEMYQVDILLCDIEMPQGSGLDLLRWIRQYTESIQSIFLTSFANFSYAQQALSLDSLEYYLKPVDYTLLEAGLAHAVEKATQVQESNQLRRHSEYWLKNHNSIKAYFWRQILSGKCSGDAKCVWDCINEEELPYTISSLFFPVMIHLLDRKESLDRWTAGLFEYGLCNIAAEVFGRQDMPPTNVQPQADNRWIVILPISPADNNFLPRVEAAAQQLIESINRYFHLDIFCGLGLACVIHELYEVIRDMSLMLADNVSQLNQPLRLQNHEQNNLPYLCPDIESWEMCLDEGNSGQLYQEIFQYIDKLCVRQAVNLDVVKQFRLDITQLIYAYLRRRGIQAHTLFNNTESEQLDSYSCASIDDLKCYVQHLLDTAIRVTDFTQHPESVAEKVAAYIDGHFQEDMSRGELAKTVFLNLDYLSRLFKKEMGESINSYITKKRMGKARELLRGGDMPVNAISLHIGYDNFAYFSTLFRKFHGMSPNEYRFSYRKITHTEVENDDASF